jgi:hypothetical protein
VGDFIVCRCTNEYSIQAFGRRTTCAQLFALGGWWWCKGGRVYCFSESGGPLKLMTGVLFVLTMMGVCIRNVRQRSVYKFSHVSNNSRLTTQIRLQDPGWVWFIYISHLDL